MTDTMREPRSPGLHNPSARKHIIVGGTGRAGTTLLVRIFTRLGLDTGYSEEDLTATENSPAKAGLERHPAPDNIDQMPLIIKSPGLVDVLDQGLSAGWLKVDHAIIPVRDVGDAARSRVSVTLRSLPLLFKQGYAPGGVWKFRKAPHRYSDTLRQVLYDTIHALARHEVPVTLLAFPRFAQDSAYFARVMEPVLGPRFGIDANAIRAAHAQEARPDLITIGQKG